jgi:hypothetical protein
VTRATSFRTRMPSGRSAGFTTRVLRSPRHAGSRSGSIRRRTCPSTSVRALTCFRPLLYAYKRSAGPGNCIGRSLALHELRTILSAVVRRFDARFAPGFTAADWTRQLKDSFILERGTLSVVLTKRA